MESHGILTGIDFLTDYLSRCGKFSIILPFFLFPLFFIRIFYDFSSVTSSSETIFKTLLGFFGLTGVYWFKSVSKDNKSEESFARTVFESASSKEHSFTYFFVVSSVGFNQLYLLKKFFTLSVYFTFLV